MRSHRRSLTFAAAVVVIVVLSVVGVALFVEAPGKETIGAGVVRGLIVAFFSTAVLGLVAFLWRSLQALSGEALEIDGVRRAVRKSDLRSEDWLGILKESEHEFYVAGHSLGKWCEASHKSTFEAEVFRVLKNGGQVTLVMLGLDSEPLRRLQTATGTNYTDRVRQSRRVLAEMRTSLGKAEVDRLKVCVLREHHEIPYMVVGNERRLLTATYLASTESDAMTCLELERRSEVGSAIYDDFHKLAEQAERAEFGEQTSAPGLKPKNRRPRRLRVRITRRFRRR